ncbi:MAG: hypothetical protein EPN65_16610 [Pandoraea sp.]|uniref:HNH endonuclease n=1 Tax=Pandoraea sp. TaxID=1883445 RepID=UPI001210333F|nr:HNH endonuclease [Pandoraea sp.]TAM15935.1 MAG: hypothetical protein EPN65_16610 [Pandoraea sp.]
MNEMIAAIERHIERIPEAGCWIWRGALNRTGYGQFSFLGKHMTAHRASFLAHGGELANGEWVLHRCDVRCCVNPAHLYAGTAVDNRRDTLQRSDWRHPFGLRTRCSAGHEYSVVGFRIAADGSRVCRECMKLHMRRHRLQNKAQL